MSDAVHLFSAAAIEYNNIIPFGNKVFSSIPADKGRAARNQDLQNDTSASSDQLYLTTKRQRFQPRLSDEIATVFADFAMSYCIVEIATG